MRYHQPRKWPLKADYTRYIRSKITDANKADYIKAKGILLRIQKLGPNGVDELLLKLASFYNQSVI